MSSGMWAEKYRPQNLDDMVNQTEIVSRLKNFVKDRNLPHLLFVGPAGVGKTTSILALAQDLYGPGYRSFILELNASDERGIDVIREKVKNFARTAAISSEVPFKILIMDEADSLTSAAQHALRRTMEIYTRTCRFCLIGNYSERIIEPIQSRCSVFRFGPLSEKDLKGRVRSIAKEEGVNLIPEGLDAIFDAAEGDLRKATNLLQAAAATQGGEVDDIAIYGVLGRVSPGKVREMINLGLKGEFLEAREVLRSLLIDEGLAAEDIIRMIYSEILRLGIPEKRKVQLSDAIGEVDYRLTQGARPEIQLSALLAKLALAGEEMY
ncbi:MAG: replication factor C small subunit [Candidatus Bathyarchaeota archaeon]|jgi:replication factor C small subunit|nr:replication factor C small subunit [Candidatus Bathyarchaeota archaeon]MDH5791415.1 replication factor C small subunit [Candidatus Bathyarchaeota archaeon]